MLLDTEQTPMPISMGNLASTVRCEQRNEEVLGSVLNRRNAFQAAVKIEALSP